MIRFRCYDTAGDGTGPVYAWYRDLPPEARAEVVATISVMATYRNLDEHPLFKPLRGKCEGLDEIIITIKDRATAQRREFRILGAQGPGRGEFTILDGFEKTGVGSTAYGVPCVRAMQRWEGVKKHGDRAPFCAFPPEPSSSSGVR